MGVVDWLAGRIRIFFPEVALQDVTKVRLFFFPFFFLFSKYFSFFSEDLLRDSPLFCRTLTPPSLATWNPVFVIKKGNMEESVKLLRDRQLGMDFNFFHCGIVETLVFTHVFSWWQTRC